ncbi:MAG: 30S ribosomal protein S20 [Bacilli bacterium]
MPNIKSQIKRVKTNEKARNRNAHFKTMVRTQMKKVRLAITASDVELAKTEYTKAVSLLDKAAQRGVFHPNKVARHKSALARDINALEA